MNATPIAKTWLALSLLLPGCPGGTLDEEPDLRRPFIGPEQNGEKAPDEQTVRCERALLEALSGPAVPGVPALDGDRERFFAKVKAEPVLFVRPPVYDESAEVSLTVRGFRQRLGAAANPFGDVERILSESTRSPKQAREALLRDGYLYADEPRLAYALATLVEPQHLFGHDRIYVQRGEEVLAAERRRDRFYFTEGALSGQRVRLVLFDRVSASPDFAPPVHRDLRALRYRLHFDRMVVRHVTQDRIVANLGYGALSVPTVLATSGARVNLECEVVPRQTRHDLEVIRERATRRARALQSVRRIILQEVDEALPFDEPLHEYGIQLDGKLRTRWLEAYSHGNDRFEFHGDEYRVFDPRGRPLVPQVCVDFLTDTLERAGGSWWRGRGEPPGKTPGTIDFSAMPGEPEARRRAPVFVDWAKGVSDAFEVLEPADPVEFGEQGEESAFYAYLSENSRAFAPGDAVFIKGKTPWDPLKVHYHSFFVYESDPITGFPIVIAGNAGRPTLRVWETEVRRTPKRAIVARIRFSTDWLERVATAPPLEGPPPLSANPD